MVPPTQDGDLSVLVINEFLPLPAVRAETAVCKSLFTSPLRGGDVGGRGGRGGREGHGGRGGCQAHDLESHDLGDVEGGL